MRIGFKIILDGEIKNITPDGFEAYSTNEITVEINPYSFPYEELYII